MNTASITEYQVQIFRYLDEAIERWRAYAVALPQITAEGESREAVLEEISRKLSEAVQTSEIVTVPVHNGAEMLAVEEKELIERLKAKGYRHVGICAQDPGALELFDEIERQRDQYHI